MEIRGCLDLPKVILYEEEHQNKRLFGVLKLAAGTNFFCRKTNLLTSSQTH